MKDQRETDRKDSPRPTSGASQIVRLAEEYVCSSDNRHVMIAELCHKLGVSERKLNNVFRAHRGMPPDSALKAQRLDRTRDRLRGMSSENGLVKIAAIENGFVHLGRFNSSYMPRVGKLPSETLKRSVAPAAPQRTLEAQE